MTKVVMAMERVFINDTLREPGTVFYVLLALPDGQRYGLGNTGGSDRGVEDGIGKWAIVVILCASDG